MCLSSQGQRRTVRRMILSGYREIVIDSVTLNSFKSECGSLHIPYNVSAKIVTEVLVTTKYAELAGGI